MTTIQPSIPSFELPFVLGAPQPAVANEAALGAWLNEWFNEVGFFDEASARQTVSRWRIPRFVQLTTPGCHDEEGAQLKCAWIAWFHQFDDQFDSRPLSHDLAAAEAFVRPFLEATRRGREGVFSSQESDSGLLRAFVALNRWAVEPMSAGWRRRWFDDLDDYVRAYVTETRHRAAGTILPPEELLELKRVCMGQRSVLNLLERIVTDELSPAAQALTRPHIDTVSDITGAMNDPVSLERERAHGDVHNLVLSLMHHRGMSEAEAVAEVVSFVKDRSQALAQAIDHVSTEAALADEREKVATWMTSCGRWVSGYHEWLRETGRYDRAS